MTSGASDTILPLGFSLPSANSQDEQRLRFDDGAQRVLIGETLTEPEREWVAGLLNAWEKG